VRRFINKTLILLILTTGICRSQAVSDDSLRSVISARGEAEVLIARPGRPELDIISRHLSISSVREGSVYITLTPATVEWFLGLGKPWKLIPPEDPKGLVTAASVKDAMEWDTYPTYTQYDSIMRKLQADYPQLCRLDTIGTSIYGKQVLVLKISDNVADDEDEPEVFYSSTMHGDELAGFVLMLRLADHLLRNYSSDTRVKNLVDNLEIWINPLANPDGTYRTGNIISSPTRTNAEGYDLNRKFPDPLDPSIVPPKENVDMISFMRKRRFVLSANFHSGFEVVNFPWDRWFSKYHADHNWFYEISRRYADTVHAVSGLSYLNEYDSGVVRGSDWYTIYGGRQDFITWELQGREVTIELDYVKQTPAAQLELLWQYNRQSFIGYLENALYGIHGRVLDDATSEPVPARVFIDGHDKDSSHVYADTTTGSFIRMLSPGTWDLRFSAYGYRDTVVTGVQVLPLRRTDLTVYMKSDGTKTDSVYPETPLLFPVPANEYVECRLPSTLQGRISVTIYTSAGAKIKENITGQRPLILNVRGLAPGVYIAIFRSLSTGVSYRAGIVVAADGY